MLRSGCAEQRMLREIGGVLQGSPCGTANMTYSDCLVEALRIINQNNCLIIGMMILILFADDNCWGGLKRTSLTRLSAAILVGFEGFAV